MSFSDTWGYIVSVVGASGITQFVNWRYQVRKNKEDVKGDQIANMQKAMQDFYEPLLAAQNKRIAEMEIEIDTLRKERREMETQYQIQIASLQEQIVTISAALGIRASKIIKEKEKEAKR